MKPTALLLAAFVLVVFPLAFLFAAVSETRQSTTVAIATSRFSPRHASAHAAQLDQVAAIVQNGIVLGVEAAEGTDA